MPDYLRGADEGPSCRDGEELRSTTGATRHYSEGTHWRHAAHQDGDHEDTGGWGKVDRWMGASSIVECDKVNRWGSKVNSRCDKVNRWWGKVNR